MPKLKKTIPIVEAKKHARLSASGSSRWTVCHAAPRREDGLPDKSRDPTSAAAWGTTAHDLAERCLKAGDDLALRAALGKDAIVQDDGTVIYCMPNDGNEAIRVDRDLIDCAQVYIDFVRDLAKGGELLVEQRLSIEHITGEPGARGTSDSVIIFPGGEICIVDLKGGFMRVTASDPLEGHDFATAPEALKVRAMFEDIRKPNTQLVMYAEAARNELEFFHEFERVRIIIVQPRLNHIDEFVMPIADFMLWVEWIRQQAEATRSPDAKAAPGPDQCTFCKAYPCPEAEAEALSVAIADFEFLEDIEQAKPRQWSTQELGKVKRMLPMLRKFCDYIDARTYAELEAGRPVEGYKMIDGEMGDRKWKNEYEAEKALLNAGVSPSDYKVSKLVSPAQAEGLTRRNVGKLSKEAFKAMESLIVRAPGSPKVVEANDPRPARSSSVADDFDFEDDSSSDFFEGL